MRLVRGDAPEPCWFLSAKRKNNNMFHAWQNSRTEWQTAQPTSLEIGQPMKSHYPPTSDFSCVYLVPQFNDWSGGKVQGVQLVTSHRLSANLLPQTWKFTPLWFPIFDSGKVGRNKLAWCYMSVLSCYCAVLVSPRVAWSSQNRLWVSKTGWDTPATPHPNAQN